MNTTPNTTTRPTLSLPFGSKAVRSGQPAPTTTLSNTKLEEIAAAMLG